MTRDTWNRGEPTGRTYDVGGYVFRESVGSAEGGSYSVATWECECCERSVQIISDGGWDDVFIVDRKGDPVARLSALTLAESLEHAVAYESEKMDAQLSRVRK